MRKRNLVKQMASFGMAIVMSMGGLLSVPVVAQTTSENVMAEEVSGGTKATEIIDYDALNAEIYDKIEDYPTGGLEEGGIDFKDAIVVESAEEYYQLLNGNAAVMMAATNDDDEIMWSTSAYPSEVDNSTNENAIYLPKVLSQYGGSCVSYAYIYELASYTINQARGISSKDTDNVLSPLFAHNIIRATASHDDGSWESYARKLILEIGAPTAGYAPISRNYANYMYTWYPTEEAWNCAADNRIESAVRISDISTVGTPITSADDSDLDLIKATLSSGKIMGFCTYFRTFNYTVIPAESPSHAGEHAVDRCDYYLTYSDGTRYLGGHAMVVVGYDDNIWIDVNRDGEQQTGEFGALKIMNSHGTSYKNSGFVWVAYDALNNVSSVITDEDVERVNTAIEAGIMTGSKIQNQYRKRLFSQYGTLYTYIASSEKQTSGCRLVATLNTNDRQDVSVFIMARNKATGEFMSYDIPMFKGFSIWDMDYSLAGSKSQDDGTIVIDLDNVVSDITPESIEDYAWSVMVTDAYNGTAPLIVKDLCIKVDGVRVLAADLATNTLDASTVTYEMEQAPVYVESFNVSSEKAVSLYDYIELNATAVAGSGNYEYRFGTVFNGIEYEISDGYQESSSVNDFCFYGPAANSSLKADAVGIHTLFVDVRDTETGEIARATIDKFEVKALEVTSFNVEPEPVQKVGTAINLSVDVAYSSEHKYNTVHYYVIKDGVETRISNNPDYTKYMTAIWTPTEPGNYTLKCVYIDYLGQEATATKDYQIVSENQTTIYYSSSWSNVYIHYKVGDGSWTAVPGVKMVSDSSKADYQWKYVIDMDEAAEATVCFNNGSGSWDSKNGANYTLGVGTYGIKNGTVEEINDNLTLVISADKAMGGTFTTSTFTAQAGNGTEPYMYQFAHVVKGVTPTESSFTYASTNNKYTITPYSEQEYEVYVRATDANGKKAETTMDYVIEGPKWTTFTATATDRKIGTEVTINAEISNVQWDSYNKYSFLVEMDGEIFLDTDTGSVGNITWTPTKAGTYTITAKYVTYSGAVYETTMTYEVYDSNKTTIYYGNSSWSQAYIHYQIGNGSWTSVPGVKMSTNTSSNGYTWKYVVDLGDATNITVCFNDGNGSWDSKNGSNYTLNIGTYGIKNNTITELEEKLSVNLVADKSVGGTYTTTVFTVAGSNGTAPYTYKMAIVSKGAVPTDNSYFAISSTGVYNYIPQTAGNYTVFANVTDGDGNTAVTSMDYAVEGPQFKNFTATAEDNKVGTAVTLTAEFVNFKYDKYNTYAFVIEKDGVSTSYSAGSTGTYVWTPTEEGTYTITAQFKTFSGAIYEKSMTYEVSNGNTVTIYYNSSWSNANIHYCIAGGSWTAVPGVAMTKTSEKSGYTHKIVIDLGTASSITICFNNGNGSWDSRNGANYTAYAGTYGVSNGTVSKLN